MGCGWHDPDLRVRGGEEPVGPGSEPDRGMTMEMSRVFVLLGELLQTGPLRVSERFVRT